MPGKWGKHATRQQWADHAAMERAIFEDADFRRAVLEQAERRRAARRAGEPIPDPIPEPRAQQVPSWLTEEQRAYAQIHDALELLERAAEYLEDARMHEEQPRDAHPDVKPNPCAIEGCRQLLAGCGLGRETPLQDLGVDGFYDMADALGLRLIRQALLRPPPRRPQALDRMRMAFGDSSEPCVTLYNRVVLDALDGP